MSLPGYDEWLDNYGNPDDSDENGQDCTASHCPPGLNGVCEWPLCREAKQ
jgi:hypothetical protein